MALRQFLSLNKNLLSPTPNSVYAVANYASKASPYLVKVGIPEFLQGVGNGVESHIQKIEGAFGNMEKLLVARTWKLKRLDIPIKQRKLILKYTHKYRLGLWRPRAVAVKS